MGLTWQESLMNIRKEILATQVPLRFNQTYVPVSSIALQFYCEAKVDCEYRFGQVPTLEKEEGTKLHDEIMTMKPTTLEALVKSIEEEPLYVCTFHVYLKVEGLVVVGKPDAVVFKKSKPSYIIELKTTGGDVNRLWCDEVVQVKTYALALDSMGFDCKDLRLLLVKVNRNEIPDEAKKLLLPQIVIACMRKTEKKPRQAEEKLSQIARLRIHTLDYDRREALEDIQWAKDYWLMKREAIPTKKPSKCRSCEFKEKCPYSLVREWGFLDKS